MASRWQILVGSSKGQDRAYVVLDCRPLLSYGQHIEFTLLDSSWNIRLFFPFCSTALPPCPGGHAKTRSTDLPPSQSYDR